MIAAQFFQGGDGGDEFLAAGGAHALTFVVGEDHRVGGEVIDIKTDLRAEEDFVVEQFFQSLRQGEFLHLERVLLFGTRQRVGGSHRVGLRPQNEGKRVGQFRHGARRRESRKERYTYIYRYKEL